MRILNTFLSDIITQSNTAFSAGTRLIIFSGRNTRRSFIDFSLAPVGVPLHNKTKSSLVFIKILFEDFLFALTSVSVKIKSDSYYLLEVKGKDSTADHRYIHDIPNISQICARMEEHAQV